MELGSLVEVTVNLNHSANTELLEQPGLSFAHRLTGERNIPIPVFQDGRSGVHRAANVTDWHDEHSTCPRPGPHLT